MEWNLGSEVEWKVCVKLALNCSGPFTCQTKGCTYNRGQVCVYCMRYICWSCFAGEGDVRFCDSVYSLITACPGCNKKFHNTHSDSNCDHKGISCDYIRAFIKNSPIQNQNVLSNYNKRFF
jgi:hypothetical protein